MQWCTRSTGPVHGDPRGHGKKFALVLKAVRSHRGSFSREGPT